MKKSFAISIIWVLLLLFIWFTFKVNNDYRILKVLSATDFYVDYNNDFIPDPDELVQLLSYDTYFEDKSKFDNIKLNFLADEFANNFLLNQVVKIDKNNPDNIWVKNINYYDLLVKSGFIANKSEVSIVEKRVKEADSLDLVIYNRLSDKYHKIDCPYASQAINTNTVKIVDLPKSAKPCKFCLDSRTKTNFLNNNINYPRFVKDVVKPFYDDGSIELYVTDFTKYFYPSSKCSTLLCKSLLYQINNAQNSIDFAIYGIDGQDEIFAALVNAQKRGVKIRWVYDKTTKGEFYKDCAKLSKFLTAVRTDIEYNKSSSKAESYKDSIMHNKFFIFDNSVVWTGSANITNTDLSGFNANSAVLIKSQQVANLYKAEFEKMFAGEFHNLKSKTMPNSINIANSTIEVAFSPQDLVLVNKIIPLVNSAKSYIYVPVFVITHKKFANSLIQAKKRGVDVRVIIDATSAPQKYSSVKNLRDNNVLVKTENRAGKMHMKSIVIDDQYTVIGSMNFTKSGESYNDENVLIIKNEEFAKAFKKTFLLFWNSIPNKWSKINPQAESVNSINSCYDGIDNDFDGLIDMQDTSCNYVND